MLAAYLAGAPNNGVFAPWNLGLYTYVGNRPLVARDPSGAWGEFMVEGLHSAGTFAQGFFHGLAGTGAPTGHSAREHATASALGQLTRAIVGLGVDANNIGSGGQEMIVGGGHG